MDTVMVMITFGSVLINLVSVLTWYHNIPFEHIEYSFPPLICFIENG